MINKELLSDLTILFVEDEHEVREFTGKILEPLVKKVHLAQNGEEGLSVFKKHQTEIDLVIADINMPKLNGFIMSDEIKNIKNDIPLFITSAYNDPEFLKNAIDLGVSAYLMKPIDLYQLINSIIKAFEPKLLLQKLKDLNPNDSTKIKNLINEDANIVFISNDSKITHANDNFLNFFNVKTLDNFYDKYERIYKLFEISYGFISEEKFTSKKSWLQFTKDLTEVKKVVKIYDKEGELKTFCINIDSIKSFEKEYIVTFIDITKNEAKERLIDYENSYDSLTGLFNKHKFDSIFGKELRRTQRYNADMSLILFDIDNLKQINETFGHEIGDKVVKKISVIATDNIREHDIIARWDEDNFSMLLPQTNEIGAYIVAEKVRKEIQKVNLEGIDFELSASFGVSMLKINDDKNNIFNRASKALSDAKIKGKNIVVVF